MAKGAAIEENRGIGLGAASGVFALRVEGAVREIWEVDEEFVRPSHNVVLGRDSGSHCVRPIWATGLIRHLTMWCSRPTNVRGLHHQRSQPQVTPFTSGKGRRLLHITLLSNWPTLSSE